MEQALDHYAEGLQAPAAEESQPFQVFLFASEAHYLNYTRDLAGAAQTGTLGIYHGWLGQLLAWESDGRDQLMRTLRHEGFHQYLDRVMENPPQWFNEGLAEYYEVSRDRGGRWKDGRLKESHVKLLNSGPSLRTLDLSRFPFLGHKSCRAGGVRNYAIAWSLVHFLRHSGEEGLEIFDKLFAELLVGTDNRTAIERAFTGHDLDRLERELLLYVADLAQ